MTLQDHVVDCIRKHPILFKDSNFERSKLKVLHHMFIVGGNGYEWAMSRKEEGYLIEPKYYKRNGEWVRRLDPPYGKIKVDPLPENYFETEIRRYLGDSNIDVFLREKRGIIYFVDESKEEFAPYPFWETAQILDIKTRFVQPDWLEGAKLVGSVVIDKLKMLLENRKVFGDSFYENIPNKFIEERISMIEAIL